MDMITRLMGALAAVLMVGVGDVRSGDFQAGAAMRIITPDPLLPVSGGVGEPKSRSQLLRNAVSSPRESWCSGAGKRPSPLLELMSSVFLQSWEIEFENLCLVCLAKVSS